MSLPRVYGMSSSGNCYKVRLLLEQLQLPYDWIEIDIRSGTTRQAEFLHRNPNGRVPTLEYQPGQYLAESNAILVYLAEGSRFWPQHRIERAQALQWMFFEQYSHEPYVAVARFWKHYVPTLTPLQEMRLPEVMTGGYAALDVMEKHLAVTPFFVAGKYGLADIALYAYTHVADEGGFDLSRYPQINAWLARVASQPGHVSIDYKN